MDSILLMMDIYVLKDNNGYLMQFMSDNDPNNYFYAFFQFLCIYDDKVVLMAFANNKKDIWYCDIDNFKHNFVSIRDWIFDAEIIGDVIMTNNNHSLVRFYASNKRTLAFDANDNCFYLVNNDLDYEISVEEDFRLEGNLLKQLIKDLKLRRKY